MNPQDYGFPDEISAFRPAQIEAVDYALTCERRFCAIGAPPGVGKSAVAVCLAKLLGDRTMILTANRGLEDQYMSKLGSMGLLNIRGRANYSCWEGGTCEDGSRMGCLEKEECPYQVAFNAANNNDLDVSNYAFWTTVHSKSVGMRPFNTLICDEAGLAFDWLSRSLDSQLGERELRDAGYRVREYSEDVEYWRLRAGEIIDAAQSYTRKCRQELKTKTAAKASFSTLERLKSAVKHADDLLDRANRLRRLDENWCVTLDEGTDDGRIWKFECIWPGRYKECLFQTVPRVVLMSATMRPKTAELLGIAKADCDFHEWPRQFPKRNGPVLYLPTTKVGYNMDESQIRDWLNRILQISAWGRDRKGIVHTVSFERARLVAKALRDAGHNVKANDSQDPNAPSARKAYTEFCDSPDGTILVSPSFSTGWDFAGRIAEWQIISKIAFPSTQGKVMSIRCKQDKGYQSYLAGQDLVQACGRINRSYEDMGVTFLLDDNWRWFRQAGKPYMPSYFDVRTEHSLPNPLPRAA